MVDAYDVPDPTDWLETPLKDFSSLENALHCQICKEFYDTPMITSCNHTWCSKCIRTSLSADGQCPACRKPDQASKLRNNWALQEVVAAFVAARPAALDLARQAHEKHGSQRSGKRKRLDTSEDPTDASERTTRSKSRRIAASQESHHEAIEIEDSDDDADEYRPETPPRDGLVACPLNCGKRMKEEEVFVHLDKCEDEKKQQRKKQAQPPTKAFGASRSFSIQDTRPQDRINELNYSMLKETALAKKLKDAGIPAWGTRQSMISRHREWVNIWNANCDSTRPRTKRELISDLDVWERTVGGKAPTAQGLSSTIMRKDFDGDAYSKKHHDEFSRLIADAKRKKSAAVPEAASTKAPDDSTTEEGIAGQVPTPQQIEMLDRVPANHDGSKPYAADPNALSAVRAKVRDVDLGRAGEPVMNLDFSASQAIPTSSQSRPDWHQQEASITHQTAHHSSQHERSGDPEPCDIPSHLQAGDAKKVPLFEVPGQTLPRLDGGAANV
jgi:E3 ubiquitin-protein ligase RAD18